jgi:hypothetical protein
MVAPTVGTALRRSAALWTHWDNDDREGIEAILAEVQQDPDPMAWPHFAVGLVNLGRHMVNAAGGDVDMFLKGVLEHAMATEVGSV